MWWLGHLVLILLVFGLGFSSREVLVAWRSLTRFISHGSEDTKQDTVLPSSRTAAPALVPATTKIATSEMFTSMQDKADTDKLAALKSQLKR